MKLLGYFAYQKKRNLKSMKRKFLTITALLMFVFAFNSMAQTRVGAGLAYGTEIENLGINANAQFFINDNIAIAPGLVFFFPKDAGFGIDINWFDFNANGHYYFKRGSVEPYVLAGLNFARIKVESGSFDSSNTEIGLNIGGGANFDIGSSIMPFGELRIVVGDADQLVIAGGVRFPIGG